MIKEQLPGLKDVQKIKKNLAFKFFKSSINRETNIRKLWKTIKKPNNSMASRLFNTLSNYVVDPISEYSFAIKDSQLFIMN